MIENASPPHLYKERDIIGILRPVDELCATAPSIAPSRTPVARCPRCGAPVYDVSNGIMCRCGYCETVPEMYRGLK